jgi:ABC-2 type transport system permease protein
MIAFWAVLRKEFLQIMRDKRLLAMLLVAPLVQLTIFGYAVNFDVESISTAICDFSNTPQSREFASHFTADGTFVLKNSPRDCTKPEEEIRSGRAEVVLVMPQNLSQRALNGSRTAVQVLVDGTNPVVGRFAANAAESFFASMNHALVKQLSASNSSQSNTKIVLVPRVFYNPEMRSSVFMVPGVAVLILLIVTMVATSIGLAREKEMGTLEQVAVTPIGRFAFLFGKVLPFVIFGLIDILAVLVLSMFLFHVPIRGSLALYFLGTFLYLLNTVGLGLLISTSSRTQQQALLSGFLLLMPAMLLSGILTPIVSMPQWLQPLTHINPLRYFGEVLRGVMLKGATAADLAPALVGLCVLGILVFTFATLRFQKTSE